MELPKDSIILKIYIITYIFRLWYIKRDKEENLIFKIMSYHQNDA
jgi:hypothetical protein